MINHYGVFVDKNKPTTGVYNGNQINWEFMDYDYTCLDCQNAFEEHGDKDYFDPNCPNCKELNNYCIDYIECSGHMQLYGDWILDTNTRLYEPDKTGEYTAIYDSNQNVFQVVWSKITVKGSLCSPCYPGQVDVGSQGDFTAYAFPDDMIYKE